MTASPLKFRWQDGTMQPLAPDVARRTYEDGQIYRLAPWEDRSANTHRHYFSCINEGWNQLPEHMADQFATPDHLRRWLLIRAGFRDERTIVLASKAEAVRVAAFIRPLDPYAVVVPRESTVVVMTAHSQSYKSMGARTFQESKEKTLDLLASMIGTDSKTLAQNAGRAA